MGAWFLLAPWSPPSLANTHGCFGTQKINCQTILAGFVSWGSVSTLSTHCQGLGVLDHGRYLLGTSLQRRKKIGRGGVGVSGKRAHHSQGRLSGFCHPLQEEATISNYAAGSEVNTCFPILSRVSPPLSSSVTSLTPCFFA